MSKYLENVPIDIVLYISDFLNGYDLANLLTLNKYWKEDDSFKKLHIKMYCCINKLPYNFFKLFNYDDFIKIPHATIYNSSCINKIFHKLKTPIFKGISRTLNNIFFEKTFSNRPFICFKIDDKKHIKLIKSGSNNNIFRISLGCPYEIINDFKFVHSQYIDFFDQSFLIHENKMCTSLTKLFNDKNIEYSDTNK